MGMDTPTTPDSALTRLLDGNHRYVAGQSRHEHQDPDRRAELAGHQNPFAQVFGCSDSRVPAEVVFDQGLGDLFVIRNAGHIVDPSVLGSIEFGVDVLSIPLTLLLGHTSCGAVGAAINAVDSHSTPSGYLRDVVERIAPAVFEARRDPEAGYEDIVIENDCRNSAIPLLDMKDVPARIEPGAIIREQVTIEKNAVIMMGAILNIGAVVGEGTMIDMGVVLGGRATVGKRCHIGAGTVLAGVIEPASATPVVIEDDVFIGANAVVIEGVRVGRGAVVAAGAVVIQDVPENAVVAGCPARVIKMKDQGTSQKTALEAALRTL